jgi:glutathione S-transferase
MKHIELYGFAGSTFVRTARMICEEKHVDYQLKPLEFRQESHRALHPFLRMPVMRIGNTILYETSAIAIYIDESFDGPRLSPSKPLARAQMQQWISTCNDYLYRDLVRALLEPDDPSEEVWAAARQDLEIVDRQLRGNLFLLGGEIYLCDLFLAPMIAFAGSKAKTPLFQGLDGLSAWRERLESRASFSATQS